MAIQSFALHDLGWQAFQQLCHTVLREELGQEVRSFLDSRDGGRDGAFQGTWRTHPRTSLSGEFVVQCKHSAKHGTTLSLHDLRDELDKAERLASKGHCDAYLLMTNCGVTGDSELAITDALRQRGVKQTFIAGSTWFNQTICTSPRLRRLVPRLYGLGDLTQILDERRYNQARAVIDSMRMDLNKLVLTATYHRALKALTSHRFVLLVGAPALGKTTIASQLALGAADEFETSVVKLESVSRFHDHWNPDESQLFWIDDVFGATQFDRELARDWVLALPQIQAAIKKDAQFVITSRDYVFRAASGHLKSGAFPLLNAAQIVVNVADITPTERRSILYNHLRHGGQPSTFLHTIHPHLDRAAIHQGFTPELARRLADPLFTTKVDPRSAASVDKFFSEPQPFLTDVMAGLDADGRAALALIFAGRDWLTSPVTLSRQDADLVARLASGLGGVVTALESLRGSLVEHVVRGDISGWIFSHPTMVDAFAELVASPEFLQHFVAGCPIDTLLRRVTCGSVGIQGAMVVPKQMHAAMLARLDEPLPSGDGRWLASSHRLGFLASRCDRLFLEAWLQRNPDRLEQLRHPRLMLDVCAENELVARLHTFGLLPETHRAAFATAMIEYCLEGVDFSVLWNMSLRSLLSDTELEALLNTVRDELLGDLDGNIWNFTRESSDDAETAAQPLMELAERLTGLFPDDPTIPSIAQVLRERVSDWVSSREADEPSSTPSRNSPGGEPANPISPNNRSVFDDLLIGRGD